MPGPARWLAAFALFLGAQTVIVHPIYLQLPLLAALYVLYAALLLWLGAQLAVTAGMERAAGVLAACLLAGALANAAAGMIQFYGLPAPLRDIVAELHHDPLHNGAYGNIAQPNLYANYLALGGTALLFLWQRASLRTAYALAAAALLAWACALSGSRAALLYALWFAVLGVLAGRKQTGVEARRLKFAAYGLAGVLLVGATGCTLAQRRAASRPREPGRIRTRWRNYRATTRAALAALALGLAHFRQLPRVAGAGIGEFAGAAFSSGLPPELTQFGNEVWIFTAQFAAAASGRDRRPGHVPGARRLVYLVVAGRAALFRRAAAGDVVDHRRGRNRD